MSQPSAILTPLPTRQFALFVLVGILNTIFSYAIFALLLWLGLHYALATAIAAALGILFNFKTTGIIVFQNRDNSRLLWYAAAQGVGYLLSVAVQRLGHEMGINAYYSGLLAIPPSVVIVFTLCRFVVFRNREKRVSS